VNTLDSDCKGGTEAMDQHDNQPKVYYGQIYKDGQGSPVAIWQDEDDKQEMAVHHWQHEFSDAMKTSQWEDESDPPSKKIVWHGYGIFGLGRNPWV
jgi:hypothetical protein